MQQNDDCSQNLADDYFVCSWQYRSGSWASTGFDMRFNFGYKKGSFWDPWDKERIVSFDSFGAVREIS